MNIKDCDLNNDFFHFTNKKNINSILNNGLIPKIGAASQLVNDRENVSVSKGGKGIMGIINSFIYKFSNELRISEIPDEYKKYFSEIFSFESNDMIGKELACKAVSRKLKEEVYFRVNLRKEQLDNAKIGGLTGYDVNLPMKVDNKDVEIITDDNNKVLSAYDVAQYIYERTKDKAVFRDMHGYFFDMFEMEMANKEIDNYQDYSER